VEPRQSAKQRCRIAKLIKVQKTFGVRTNSQPGRDNGPLQNQYMPSMFGTKRKSVYRELQRMERRERQGLDLRRDATNKYQKSRPPQRN
jgi:hypothetical protein